MILSPGTFARIGLILLFTVVLQVSGASQMHVLGGTANLVPLVVAGVAFFAGSIAGSATGFAAGLLLDLALGQLTGTSSLVLTAIGYGAGRYREVKDPAHGLAPVAFVALATLGYLVAFAGVSFMLGVEAAVSVPLILREIAVSVVLSAALALPIFWVLRRLLRGALVSDPLGRGRRERTRDSGPIGLRGLEV